MALPLGYQLSQQGINLSGANALTPKAAVQAKTRTIPKILTYPLKQLTSSTDYLQIRVVQYEPPKFQQRSETDFGLQRSTEILQKNIVNAKHYINLPMPDGIKDGNSVDWGNGSSLNAAEAYGVGAIGNVIQSKDALKSIGAELQKIPGVAQQIAVSGGQDIVQSYVTSQLIKSLGSNLTTANILSRATGQVLNPNMELLFTGVNLREFNFNFQFAPREPAEGQRVKDIIRVFKTAMAAKTTNNAGQAAGAGIFISAPDVFQLTFMTGANPHPFLYKMKPCALKGMSVDYSASGPYATYSDATPVHMELSLTFVELNPIYAEDYNTVGGVGY